MFALPPTYQLPRPSPSHALSTSTPGLHIQYDLSPVMVKLERAPRALGHFLTNLCAIVGGIFTVMGIVDRFVHHAVQRIRKRASDLE